MLPLVKTSTIWSRKPKKPEGMSSNLTVKAPKPTTKDYNLVSFSNFEQSLGISNTTFLMYLITGELVT